ncbi:MAG TPA: FUSC family protein [Solirubrobacteraceae bacterium]
MPLSRWKRAYASAVAWLGERDRGFSALRRAGRAALVMPAMFALGDVVIGNPAVATFAAFGSFAMLLLVDFGGPMRARLQAQAALAVTGGIFVIVGTLASRWPVVAALAMALVAFGVMFAGVVSSVLAGATTSLLLAFILPVSLPGPVSSIPDRLAGWGLASAAALLAIALLWPAPVRDPVRSAAIAGTRAVAQRLRAQVAFVLGGRSDELAAERDAAIAQADSAVEALHAVFFATPYRPTGLSTAARTLVRLVDELKWLNTIVLRAAPHGQAPPPDAHVGAVKTAAAAVLERGGDLLDAPQRSPDALRAALTELRARLSELERGATSKLPTATATGGVATTEPAMGDVISSLDPAFRAQELSFVVSQIATNIDWAAAAERRSWLEQLLGRQPEGLAGPVSAAQERAGAHVEQHSVWLQNSIRGAIGLGLAVLIANLTGVQHAFWVVLGTLSVLRSNALSTGQNVLRGLLGTVVGFAVGAALVELVGTDATLLWVLLPPAVLCAGLAPAAISFAAGQAAFTLTLLILFNILAPEGWQIGLVRIEDVAIGGAVSLAVGVLFWPRGAGAALGRALADAYADSAEYLAGAARFGIGRCDSVAVPAPAPTDAAARAAAAARRLDDTFRSYLAERGPKPVPLAEVTSLVTGVVGLRLAGDAVLDLWRQDGSGDGDRTAARQELFASTEQMTRWYRDFAGGLTGDGGLPDPLDPDPLADQRLVDAVSHDLRGDDGQATGTAVRMIWTGDHLDAARRLQDSLIEPARTATAVNALR